LKINFVFHDQVISFDNYWPMSYANLYDVEVTECWCIKN